MAKNDDTFTLYSPTGEAYQTSDKTEAVRLQAHGYSEEKPTPKQVSKPA